VTIEHLLTHTSGIPCFTDLPDYLTFMKLPSTPAATLARVRHLPLVFEPGSDCRYSNSGYVLLGLLLEVISGHSYADELSRAILEPLEMSNTGYDRAAPIIPGRASGHELDATSG
jgi:CubicO group peptidase (beta-lactamase class C family)